MQAKLGNGFVMVVGKATKDADYRLVGTKNSALCKLGLVVGRKEDDSPIYANIDAWWDLAGACKGVRKGDTVLALGTIEEREYNGQTYKTLRAEFASVVQRVDVPAAAPPPDSDDFVDVPDSELPF